MKAVKPQNLYLCVHGHFYQPPREDPATGKIPEEPSAAPFHDWNERILNECYKPNTEADIINKKGKIIVEINNFEYINFNFGPTLLNWMKDKYPGIFDKIVQADKKSIKKHGGHGNAIAQVYNHIIMPLANRRDKITQVKWGVVNFKHHFGRDPESIWLAETAVNKATVEVLIEEGIKYIILDPSQALKMRKIGTNKWQDVSFSNVNPKIPYRCFLYPGFSQYKREESITNTSKFPYIDIFFYDGPISKAIAFDDISYDSYKFMNRIELATEKENSDDQLISIAVDGETFGHHKKFADRTLAYLLYVLTKKKGYKVVNFGEYLELHPPQYEVVLKEGKNTEGTSWSCAHGVDRWKTDCGCTVGSMPGWNQLWREPLRNALNLLRDKLSVFYELCGEQYLKDVWKARDEYIKIILNNSKESVDEYFYFNAERFLSKEETELCLKLLEMQKFAMFMFTSCGWFFSDVTGLEAKKIIEYARQAIFIVKEIARKFNLTFISREEVIKLTEGIEEDFLEELSKAKSNMPEILNGKDIYLEL
ncbi:MAG: DUF3536 domain-containing protein [Ignavibacteria bacterium]|nr:DUF3536 domain-containing protein [Ignavibacteria bacterium]